MVRSAAMSGATSGMVMRPSGWTMTPVRASSGAEGTVMSIVSPG